MLAPPWAALLTLASSSVRFAPPAPLGSLVGPKEANGELSKAEAKVSFV